jgi:hypothetical protein
MRESKDITREELLNMIGFLRGALFIGDPPLRDLSDRELDEMQEEHTQLYEKTAFDLSDCEGDVKTASEKIASLEEKLAEANRFIEKHKYIIAEKAAREFVTATKKLCEDIGRIGGGMVAAVKRVCDDCPHRQEIPCETCKMVEEVDQPEDLERLVRRGWLGKEMTAEEREEQRRNFAHYNAALHNPNVTRELIDQEAEKLREEK